MRRQAVQHYYVKDKVGKWIWKTTVAMGMPVSMTDNVGGVFYDPSHHGLSRIVKVVSGFDKIYQEN